jgi:hypothetical protein
MVMADCCHKGHSVQLQMVNLTVCLRQQSLLNCITMTRLDKGLCLVQCCCCHSCCVAHT